MMALQDAVNNLSRDARFQHWYQWVQLFTRAKSEIDPLNWAYCVRCNTIATRKHWIDHPEQAITFQRYREKGHEWGRALLTDLQGGYVVTPAPLRNLVNGPMSAKTHHHTIWRASGKVSGGHL